MLQTTTMGRRQLKEAIIRVIDSAANSLGTVNSSRIIADGSDSRSVGKTDSNGLERS